MFCYPRCSMLSTILLGIVTPDSDSTILFIAVNDYRKYCPTTLLHPVFKNLEQLRTTYSFWTCKSREISLDTPVS